MFWFDKTNADAVFADVRSFPRKEIWRNAAGDSRSFEVLPDVKADFRELPFRGESFSQVVFDPPHMKRRQGKAGWAAIHYGMLAASWRDDLRSGFAECFRVLKTGGTLVFKWSEVEIPLREVLALTPFAPLFGQRAGRAQTTHWVTFIK